MIKFLLILFFISYLIYRVGGAFFRIMTLGNTQNSARRPRNSNVDVPKNQSNNDKGYKGGEYIDFEEVKD